MDKNDNFAEEDDLGELHTDALNISKIGQNNYKIYFRQKVKGIKTSSIKLQPALMTKSDHTEYHKIENQTKDAISKECQAMLSNIAFEDENEKQYYETKIKKSNIKKDELIEIFNQLKSEMIIS